MASAAGFTIPTRFTAQDRMSPVLARMTASVDRFSTHASVGLAYAERGFRKLMSPLFAFNRMMMGLGFYAGIFTLVMLFGRAIDKMAEFQQMQVNISTVAKGTPAELKAIATNARQVGLMYGESASKVSELQFQLLKLGNTPTDVMNMASPITSGAVALGTTPEKAADLVGGVIKGLGEQSDMTAKRMAQIAFTADATAADFESMATQLPIVTGIAAMQKVPFERILAYLGTLRNYQIHTATGSTSLKNIILDLAKQGKDIRTGLMGVASAENSVVYAFDKFGKKSVVTAVALSRELDSVEKLTRQIEGVSETFTQELALKRLDTFRGGVKMAKAAYEEFILSIDDGTGKYSAALTHMVRAAGAALLIAADSDIAREALSRMDSSVVQAGHSLITLVDRIWWLIKAFLIAKAVLIAWRAVTIGFTIVQTAFSVAMGISAAISGVYSIAMKKNAIALATFNTVTRIATAAQIGFNLAQYASPLIILGIGIALAVVGMKSMTSWIEKMTGGFLNLRGAVDGYSASLNNIPAPYTSSWYEDKMRSLERERMPAHMRNLETNPVYADKSYKTLGDRYSETEPDRFEVVPVKQDNYENDGFMRNGRLDININDPGSFVKSVGSPNSVDWIKVKTTPTNSFRDALKQ